MRLKTWKSVSFLVILTNLLALFYMLPRLDPKCKCSNESEDEFNGPSYYSGFFKGSSNFNSKTEISLSQINFGLENSSSPTLIKLLEDHITVVIREFENFEHNLPDTLKSILSVLPNVSILIITDTKPYPPLGYEKLSEKPLKNIKLVSLKPDPTKSKLTSQPENYVKTKYLVFWPDSARLSSALQISKMLVKLEDKITKIVAAKVAGGKGKCLNVDVDLLKWTLTYENLKKPSNTCNFIEGSHVIALPFKLLQSLSQPWSRPFPDNLFIQTALRGLKASIMDTVLFLSGETLFTDSHKKWKKDSLTRVRQSQFFNELGIKKVVDEIAETMWYGCTKESQRCFGTIVNDMPEYLFENRWTPPCCLEHLRETTRHVVSILEKCGMRYWLEGGSLLGAARYEDIIPWDYDVDFGIYKEDIDKCEWLKNSQKQSIVDTKGFVWEKAKEGDFFRVQYSATNHLHIDLFPFYSKNGVMTKDTWFLNHKQDTEFPEHFLTPLTTIKFMGIYVSAPNNIRDFLELKFGKKVIEKPEYPAPHILKFPFS